MTCVRMRMMGWGRPKVSTAESVQLKEKAVSELQNFTETKFKNRVSTVITPASLQQN